MSDLGISPSTWKLVWGGVLTLDRRSEARIPSYFSSPRLIYETVYDANLVLIGYFNRQEFIGGVGWTVVSRHNAYVAKNLLLFDESSPNQYQLTFTLVNTRIVSIPVQLKIWKPTMPLNNPSTNTSGSTTSTTVAAATASTTLLAVNINRKGATIWNASTSAMYIDFDAAVSLTDYAVKIDAGGHYELPFNFTGQIVAIWTLAVGSAFVREFT